MIPKRYLTRRDKRLRGRKEETTKILFTEKEKVKKKERKNGQSGRDLKRPPVKTNCLNLKLRTGFQTFTFTSFLPREGKGRGEVGDGGGLSPFLRTRYVFVAGNYGTLTKTS